MTMFVGYQSQWEEVGAMFAEVSGEYKGQEKALFVGYKGKWVKAVDKALYSQTIQPYLYGTNKMAATHGESEIIMTGKGFSFHPRPYPKLDAFFPLYNVADDFDNYLNVQLMNDDMVESALPRVVTKRGKQCYGVNVEAKYTMQYINSTVLPSSGYGGFDSLALVGNNGVWNNFMSLKCFVDEIPPEGFPLYFAGNEDGSIGGWVDGVGNLKIWRAGKGFEDTLQAANWLEPGKWCSFAQKYQETGNIWTLYTHRDDTGNNFRYAPQPVKQPEHTPIQLGKGKQIVLKEPVGGKVQWLYDAPWIGSNQDQSIECPDEEQRWASLAKANYILKPNTGKYYWEIQFYGSFVNNGLAMGLHVGVCDSTAALNTVVTLTSCGIVTHTGRKFLRQGGGGTVFGSPISAWPMPTVNNLGFVMNTDTGRLYVYLNGQPYGNATGLLYDQDIMQGKDMMPVVGNSYQYAGEERFSQMVVDLLYEDKTKTGGPDYRPVFYDPPQEGCKYIGGGGEPIPGLGDTKYAKKVWFSDLVLSNNFPANIPEIVSSEPFAVEMQSEKDGKIYDVTEYVIKAKEDGLAIMACPDNVPAGQYDLSIKTPFGNTNSREFSVWPFMVRDEPFKVDFTDWSELSDYFIAGHKQWGGANGGIVTELVQVDTDKGICYCYANGDNYAGDIKGVNNVGEPVDRTKRVGACIVTRDFLTPGSYRTVAKLPIHDGVVSAFWTFHYEEVYPGHPAYESLKEEGLHEQGSDENGYYIVRNHEIDIEIPTAQKTDPDYEVVSYQNARFNSWHGELRNWNVAEDDPAYWSEYTDDWVKHGVQCNDGEFHEFRLDWHVEEVAQESNNWQTKGYIDFYIDGVFKHKITTHVPDIPGRFWIGLWFPSAANNFWAGKHANFETEVMEIKSFEFIPYKDEPYRSIGESYPMDVFRALTPEVNQVNR